VTIVHHLAHAVGSTGSAVPAYRVDLRVGAHRLVADEPTSVGGGDVGPSPFGLLLGALAACTATTLRMYATRKGWELATIDVDVRDRVGDDGRRTIERRIAVPADLPAEQLDSLVRIAERTPVTLAIQGGTPIATTFRLGTAN
jgi:putative redox protein